MTRRAITTSTFLIFPCMMGLAVTAEPLILLLLTKKWLPAVKFLQCYCLIYALWPVHTANLQAINAVGRSDLYLKLELIKKGTGLLILLITLPVGLDAMMAGSCVNAFIGLFLNALPNSRLLGYSLRELLKDLAPSGFLSLVMGGVVFAAGLFITNPLFKLLVQIPTGILCYVLTASLFQAESFNYIKDILKQIRVRKNES